MKRCLIAFHLWLACTSYVSASMWEAGELTYATGESEVSAFVNAHGDTQIQTVMCTKDESYSYRFTLLLPKSLAADMLIQAKIEADGTTNSVYAEVNQNSIEFQVDQELVATLPDSANLTIYFNEKDAAFLGVPQRLDIPMTGIDLTMRKVASECTALCLTKGFQCNRPFVSSVLWPRDFFRKNSSVEIDNLCTKFKGDHYKFNDSSSCRLALDRFYLSEGIGPLSFLNELFNNAGSLYKQYQRNWNEAVQLAPRGAIQNNVYADGGEWYQLLYSLVGSRNVSDFPNSYYEIRNYQQDSTTLVYDIDNRYEMETLKYAAVLYRRVRGSVTAVDAIEKALKIWSEFYRELQMTLPSIRQAQAVRPIIYRAMLMRVWRLAGMPQGVRLLAENSFRQGVGGKTVTSEALESQCSFFDGANGDQFFFSNDGCIKGIDSSLRGFGFKNDLYEKVEQSWDIFSEAWRKSLFYSDSIDDAVGEHPKSNLGLAMLSLFKIYGFGDYFLLRECISSRDPDICSYESEKAEHSYRIELDHMVRSIAEVSSEDAAALSNLNELWLNYYHALCDYVDYLVENNRIPLWRANFVKGVAMVSQTSSLLNISYDKEQLDEEEIINSEKNADIN